MRSRELRAKVDGAALSTAMLVGAVLALLLASGLSPAVAQDEPTTSPAPTTPVPPTTPAPPTTAAATTSQAPVTNPSSGTTAERREDPAPPVDDSSDFKINWAAVFGIVLVVALAIVALAVLLAATQRRARESRAFSRRLAEAVGRAQWIHDEGSLEVLGASSSPERLQVVWDDTRRRINDVASQAAALATTSTSSGTRDELRYLSSTLGRLTGALDTHVSLHLQLSGDPSLATALEGASETVMQRRADMNSAIGPLAARI